MIRRKAGSSTFTSLIPILFTLISVPVHRPQGAPAAFHINCRIIAFVQVLSMVEPRTCEHFGSCTDSYRSAERPRDFDEASLPCRRWHLPSSSSTLATPMPAVDASAEGSESHLYQTVISTIRWTLLNAGSTAGGVDRMPPAGANYTTPAAEYHAHMSLAAIYILVLDKR